MPPEAPQYEPSDLGPRELRGAALVVALTITAGLALGGLTLTLAGPLPAAPTTPPSEAPILVPDLDELRHAIEAEWTGRAGTYARLEGDPGHLRIPVERAARLLLARGFPARSTAPERGPR